MPPRTVDDTANGTPPDERPLPLLDPQRPPGQLPASFGQLLQQIGAELATGLTLHQPGATS